MASKRARGELFPLQPLLPTTQVTSPTTQKHFDWAGCRREHECGQREEIVLNNCVKEGYFAHDSKCSAAGRKCEMW